MERNSPTSMRTLNSQLVVHLVSPWCRAAKLRGAVRSREHHSIPFHSIPIFQSRSIPSIPVHPFDLCAANASAIRCANLSVSVFSTLSAVVRSSSFTLSRRSRRALVIRFASAFATLLGGPLKHQVPAATSCSPEFVPASRSPARRSPTSWLSLPGVNTPSMACTVASRRRRRQVAGGQVAHLFSP